MKGKERETQVQLQDLGWRGLLRNRNSYHEVILVKFRNESNSNAIETCRKVWHIIMQYILKHLGVLL